MQRLMLKSKIHRVAATQTDVNYNGSITIDRDLARQADLLENEKVDIYNVNTGARFSTYVIHGDKGVIGVNGAAARLVHAGCRKAVRQYMKLGPVVAQEEGAPYTVPVGFDAGSISLTGNVVGQPPFKGSLKHRGWKATEVTLPEPPKSLDARMLAPAEVEL